MKRRLILTLLLIASFGSALANPASEQAQARLRAAVDEVLALARKAKDQATLMKQIGPVLNKHISFEVMTRRAVGPGWRQFNPADQKRAIDLFTTLVIRSYGSKFTIGVQPEVQYKSASSPTAGRVDVSTTTVYQGSRYSVVYRMEETEAWRTTDVVIEGVSMVANYRSQLDPVFKRGGVAAVLSSLEQSAARSQ
jgi:phospholipid transport system substrate-binding protein